MWLYFRFPLSFREGSVTLTDAIVGINARGCRPSCNPAARKGMALSGRYFVIAVVPANCGKQHRPGLYGRLVGLIEADIVWVPALSRAHAPPALVVWSRGCTLGAQGH